MELHSENIRCTLISPGAVLSELQNSTSDPSSAKFVRELYDRIGISADSMLAPSYMQSSNLRAWKSMRSFCVRPRRISETMKFATIVSNPVLLSSGILRVGKGTTYACHSTFFITQ